MRKLACFVVLIGAVCPSAGTHPEGSQSFAYNSLILSIFDNEIR